MRHLRMTTITAFLVCTTISAGALAGQNSFVEDLSDGQIEGGWSYFGNPANSVEVIEDAGGNPGAYVHSTCEATNCLDTFAPQLRTQAGVESAFTGDYREREVVGLGVDLILFDVDFGAGGRPLTVMLYNDNGTPGDSGDDLRVYHIGSQNVPLVGQGWQTYDFDVPSQSETLPAGWVAQGPGSADETWNTVITDVDQVRYFYGNPDKFFIFQQWEPGFDNPRIVMEAAAAPGDIDGDGVVGVEDLLSMLSAWGECPAKGDCPADIDGDGAVGVADLLELLANWG